MFFSAFIWFSKDLKHFLLIIFPTFVLFCKLLTIIILVHIVLKYLCRIIKIKIVCFFIKIEMARIYFLWKYSLPYVYLLSTKFCYKYFICKFYILIRLYWDCLHIKKLWSLFKFPNLRNSNAWNSIGFTYLRVHVSKLNISFCLENFNN